MCRLVKKHEVQTSYSLEDLPQGFVQKEMKGVAGFAVDVTRVFSSDTLSQNRNKRSCPPSLRMIQYHPLDRLLKQLLGTRLMAGRLSLEQSVVVRIHCPQLEKRPS